MKKTLKLILEAVKLKMHKVRIEDEATAIFFKHFYTTFC